MNENELRNALDISSADVQPSRGRLISARHTAATRRRRRDGFLAAATGAACSIVAVLLAVGMQTDSTKPPFTQQLNLAAQVEASSAIPVSAQQSASRPKVLVGAAVSGRLVNIDSTTGKTISVIGVFQDETEKGQLLGGLALSSDEKSVYFDLHDNESCTPKIMRSSIAGGAPTFVVNGSTPSLSADGTTLAYVQHVDCNHEQVVARSLSSGQERIITTETSSHIASIAWSPDGSDVILDVREGDADKNRLVIARIESPADLKTLSSVHIGVGQTGTVYEWPAYLPDGRLFVSERCCAILDVKRSASRLLTVNLRSADDVKVIAIGVASKSHTSTASDATGTHLLYLSGQDLMVSDNASRPSPIAYGLVGATWR